MNQRQIDRPFLLFLSCMLGLLSVVAPGLAWGYVRGGNLSGSVELAYADYRLDADDGTELATSSFSQNYSLLWDMAKPINGGAGGYYALGLGYEWSALNTEFNSADRSINRGKLLYNGRILVAPGGLPFRLEAYSQDRNGNSFTTVPLSYYSRLSSNYLRYDIMNGQHIETGVTFWAGIRNGSYLGQYRDILSKYPRVFVDYKETLVKDDKRLEPVHYRMRDLAFVSLNKKDNWFHYRFFDYKDYLRPGDDYQQKTYLIGTIDHRNERQWIHLTNWIKTSVDLSLTETEGISPSEKLYLLNAFTQAQRRNFDVSNFTSFVRKISKDRIARAIDIPFYGHVNSNGSDGRLRFSAIYHKDEDNNLDGTSSSFEDSLYGRADYEFNRTGAWITRPYGVAGWANAEGGQIQYVKGGIEHSTNRRMLQQRDMLLGSYVAYWNGEAETSAMDEPRPDGISTTRFAEMAAYGNYGVHLDGGRARFSVTQDFWLGSGEWSGGPSVHESPRSGMALEEVPGGTRGTEFGSVTSLSYSSQPRPRLHHSISISNDFVTGDAGTHLKLYLVDGLSYSLGSFGATMENELEYVAIDDIGAGNNGAALGFGAGYWELSHKSRLQWQPNRAWKMGSSFNYDRQSYSSGNPAYESYQLTEGLQYTLLTTRGQPRTLFAFGQDFEWSQSKIGSESTPWRLLFGLHASYYPSHNLSLWARSRFESYEGGQNDTYYSAGLTLTRKKFALTVSYKYGLLGETADSAGATEKLFEASVKRVF